MNILLALVLLRHGLKSVAPSLSSTNSPAIEIVQTQWVSQELSPQVLYATNHFHWREIESTNYEEYVAGLRGIGCPEKTVRDIVLPEIEEYYDRQRLMVKVSKGDYWLAGRQRQTADRKRDAQNKQLVKEEEFLIRKLLGIDWYSGEDVLAQSDLLGQALTRFVFGPMPEDTFESMIALMGRNAMRTRELELRVSGIYTDEDEAERRRLVASLREEMLRVLGKERFDEFRARGMAIEFLDHVAYLDNLTSTECRRIALARSDAYEFWDVFGSQESTQDESAQRERVFTNAVAEILGPNRFAEYQRSRDANFREILDFAESNNLPKAKAVEVYEMRRLAEEEVSRVRADESLDEATRQQQLIRIGTEIQHAAAAALGEQVYQQYLKGKGQWIMDITVVEVQR